jgi:hypothetical protein
MLPLHGCAPSQASATTNIGNLEQRLHLQLDEQAFKDSTVGLVTRDKFLHMKNTIQERREEEAARAKRQAEEQQEQVPACAALLPARKLHQKHFVIPGFVMLLRHQQI